MGRRRQKDHDLPERLYKHHGGYRYIVVICGKPQRLQFGRDRNVAIRRASLLNEMQRNHRESLLVALHQPSADLRRQVKERDGYKCVYCDRKTELSIDHFIPFDHGGATHISNLVTACMACNASKNDRNPVEFIADLLGHRQHVIDDILDRLLPTKGGFYPGAEISDS